MMRQMRESNPQVAAMLENPEMVCTLLLSCFTVSCNQYDLSY
jgi:hypothetical protein